MNDESNWLHDFSNMQCSVISLQIYTLQTILDYSTIDYEFIILVRNFFPLDSKFQKYL